MLSTMLRDIFIATLFLAVWDSLYNSQGNSVTL